MYVPLYSGRLYSVASYPNCLRGQNKIPLTSRRLGDHRQSPTRLQLDLPPPPLTISPVAAATNNFLSSVTRPTVILAYHHQPWRRVCVEFAPEVVAVGG